MRVISSQFFSGTKEMTRARIMRVNSRQKRVNEIRASFVKDARRQMRVDTRSLAGAYFQDICKNEGNTTCLAAADILNMLIVVKENISDYFPPLPYKALCKTEFRGKLIMKGNP